MIIFILIGVVIVLAVIQMTCLFYSIQKYLQVQKEVRYLSEYFDIIIKDGDEEE